MADTVFKAKVEQPEEPVVVAKSEPTSDIDVKVETPYLDTPNFLDTYFGIGSEWHDKDAEFYPEVAKIDSYIKSKISDGEIGNDQKAVRNLLSSMEKMNNLRNETRSVVKLEVLANYVEFLMKNETLKSNLKRYG